jgi:hypothetical protein
MNIKAMKLALEALEAYRPVIVKRHGLTYSVGDKAIAALRQAIEQAEQAQPVATVYDAYDTTGIDWHCKNAPAPGTKLYTAPPPRQPLTDETLVHLAAEHLLYEEHNPNGFDMAVKKFARAIEAKLKEKNA